MRLNRSDRSLIGEWWLSVDRTLLFALVLLMVSGVLISLAASPPVAVKLGLEPFHFVKRHAAMLVPALIIMIAVSMLTPRHIRRTSLVLLVVGLLLMGATLFFGPEIKGATRWISIFGVSLQPSEFVKPAFVVLIAWAFGEHAERSAMPGAQVATGLFVLFAILLLLQPDFGQTLLVAMLWGAVFFLAGMPAAWVVALAGMGVVGLLAAYLTIPHVAQRIDRFIDPSSGDTYQTDMALQSFVKGGWLGRGPGEGTVKSVLPDSHTDFVFAVVAEEFGIICCLLLIAAMAFIVLRALQRASGEPIAFIRLAVCGLVLLFGLQAAINMAVNVGLLPAKGMTLPFISYGRSSMIGMAIAMGFVLGLTRRRPRSLAVREPDAIFPARRLAPGDA